MDLESLRAALGCPDLPPDLPLPPFDDAMIEKWAQHVAIVERMNESLNLTRITGPDEAAVKHVLDSVLAWSLLPKSGRVVDMGSGGGYPGLPLAIAAPNLSFILTESVGKRARFLQSAVKELELPNVQVLEERAETVVRRLGESDRVELVVARAVGSADKSLRVLRPARGRFARLLLYKGPKGIVEEREAREEAKRAGLWGRVIGPFDLPDESGSRAFLEYTPRQ